MATELEGNLQLQRFIQLLADLNHQSAAYMQTSDDSLLAPMNKSVEEMYAIQRVGTEDAYTAIEEDMQTICKNFNAAVAMIQSNDKGAKDMATFVAVKKFVRNIFEATVRIIHAYGLA
ncbi:MAG: hypothetical protein IJV83_00525 [Clostridia bacterium]|nr:hypothetical protein [Clostridia bacterium]